ncbi:beta-lactamase/transpeptidase-like protein [Cokeromyces recurvatus]|uniref:beta-lactamase/transpeptidase-like protein n=1 Tax=Cokeromyces recurvatus TaxID=90255 RepID=UPI00221EF7AA|nr:beta-lactamase/transpeptidase-like protein [Cokeromyces recurvatus]KAI7900062.1 beta-lactamase/transpeptidase-like protein [Cokeromyces recurvatus]
MVDKEVSTVNIYEIFVSGILDILARNGMKGFNLVTNNALVTYQLLNKECFKHSLCALTYDLVGPCLRSTKDVPIHGTIVDPEFQFIRDIFVNSILKGYEVGAGFTVYVDGQKVISLQGGWQDLEKNIEYTNETLQMVFSSTKALSAIVIAQMVDQGLLSYDERISTYWPEFAQGNKENVTLMDLMRHTSGIGALDKPLSYENVTDPVVFSNILASQPHNFNGRRYHSYHAITQGWYQNEILKRVANCTIDEYIQNVLNKQYKDIEFYLKPDAMPNADQLIPRIATFYDESELQKLYSLIKTYLDPRQDKTFIRSMFDKNSLFTRTIIHPNIDQMKGVMNNKDPKHRAIEGPSYSAHTNADSLAKLAAMMANKGQAIVPGEPDLFQHESTYEEATYFNESWRDEPDLILPFFPLNNQKGGFLIYPHDRFFGIEDPDGDFEGGSGAGGSLFLYNRKYKIGLAYVMNGYVGIGIPDPKRTIPLVKGVFEQVKKMSKK